MASLDPPSLDLIVIGAGSGGVACARRAGAYGARVAICEEVRVGGTCVLRGCVPKKLLVYASHVAEEIADAAGYGWSIPSPAFDWPRLIRNKNAELDRLNGIYEKMLGDASVPVLRGRATLIDEHTVEVVGERRRAERILVATGGRPWMPAIPGVEHAIDSDRALDLESLPERMVVGGGGYIAVEFAGIFRSLGVEVTVVIRGDRLLRSFDADLARHLENEMRRGGVTVRTGSRIAAIRESGRSLVAEIEGGDALETDSVFLALGRRPNTRGIGLEEAGVRLRDNGAVAVDEELRSSVSSVYALGDCTDRRNLTPVAIAEGRALAETWFNDNPCAVTHENVATAVFSQPPIGTVGLTEEEARRAFADVAVYRSSFRPMKNTLSGNPGRALMKLVADGDTGRVLGCHLIGPDAPEIVQGVAIALKCGATKAQFDDTMAIHPTAAEELVTMYEPVVETVA